MPSTPISDAVSERDRFRCTLTIADEPECGTYAARVTVIDAEGSQARGCARHAVAALDAIDGLRVVWTDTVGLNEFEVRALRLTEERNGLRPILR